MKLIFVFSVYSNVIKNQKLSLKKKLILLKPFKRSIYNTLLVLHTLFLVYKIILQMEYLYTTQEMCSKHPNLIL